VHEGVSFSILISSSAHFQHLLLTPEQQNIMSDYLSLAGNVVGVILAALYTYAGQAHMTNRLTPEFAKQVDVMTHNSYRAFWFLGLDYHTVSTKCAQGTRTLS
jgi:hypothetical protein